MTAKKTHLARRDDSAGRGARSVCRYSARPSSRVSVVTRAQFDAAPEAERCTDCQRYARRDDFLATQHEVTP